MKRETTFSSYILPREVGVVPSLAGVYRFVFRLPSDYELGLSGDDIDIARAVRLLTSKLNRLADAMNSRVLTGVVSEDKQVHLQIAYGIVAESSPTMSPGKIFSELVEKVDQDVDLLAAIKLLRGLVGELPPVYVGITIERTLQVRLREHLDGSTRLLQELERYGLSWSDLKFQCVPVPFYNGPALRKIEQLLQLLHKPIFSRA